MTNIAKLCDDLKRKERIKSEHEHKPFVVTLLVSFLLLATQSLVEINPITDFEQRQILMPAQLYFASPSDFASIRSHFNFPEINSRGMV